MVEKSRAFPPDLLGIATSQLLPAYYYQPAAHTLAKVERLDPLYPLCLASIPRTLPPCSQSVALTPQSIARTTAFPSPACLPGRNIFTAASAPSEAIHGSTSASKGKLRLAYERVETSTEHITVHDEQIPLFSRVPPVVHHICDVGSNGDALRSLDRPRALLFVKLHVDFGVQIRWQGMSVVQRTALVFISRICRLETQHGEGGKCSAFGAVRLEERIKQSRGLCREWVVWQSPRALAQLYAEVGV